MGQAKKKQRRERNEDDGRTCLFHDAGFALGKGDVTSGLVLNEFDLDLAPAGLLVGLWLVFVVVIVCAGLASFMVLDKGIFRAGDLLL